MRVQVIVLIVVTILANANAKFASSNSNVDVSEDLSSEESFKNDRNWQNYKILYKKQYESDHEEAARYENYLHIDAKIQKHNEKYERGEVLYKMGHNKFSDMTRKEIKRIHPTIKKHSRSSINSTYFSTLITAPESLSYQSSCLPVVDQGNCGSCWAFAATAQVETQLKRKNPSFNTQLSPQNLLDCAPNGGCKLGGSVRKGLAYMYKNGLVSWINEPYVGRKLKCTSSPFVLSERIAYPPVSVKVNGNEQQLMDILATYGPVAVKMYAPKDFYYYTAGIFYESKCPRRCKKTNHAMLLVGYGRESLTNTDFWLLKNSHGTEWGENGYVRMIRNSQTYRNNCNIACFANYAEV